MKSPIDLFFIFTYLNNVIHQGFWGPNNIKQELTEAADTICVCQCEWEYVSSTDQDATL